MIKEKEGTKVKLVEWFDEHWYKILVLDPVEYFVSTTTVLQASPKPFLSRWRGEIGNLEADIRVREGGDRGSRMHAGWYALCQSGAVIYNPPKKPVYQLGEIQAIEAENLGNLVEIFDQGEMFDLVKLKMWLDAVKPRILASETTVFSLENKRAGTLDTLVHITGGSYLVNGKKPIEIEGGMYILDLKSGKALDDDAFMQTADYGNMLEGMPDLDIQAWLAEYGALKGTIIIHTQAGLKTGIPGLATVVRTRAEMEQDYLDMEAVAKIWKRKNPTSHPDLFEFPTLLKYEKNETEEV